uniref:Hydroxycinnamoyl-CoA:shikimate/quinate hydroxycinnamoyl transferase n=1 Tax=Paeonia lactiflora TaxID=35924 RepID=A0A5B9BW10_PAELC|nr:hydroxycinnamoyl-CoA:shikimate/quinate hydroxycinnamoyl transferase [Paeonia lactiflora]
MITKKPSFMVFPAKPTPNVRLPLSECDQRHAWTHTPTIYFYKPSNNYPISSAIDTVAEALSRALVLHYPVAGRLHGIQGGRFELDCNALGAQLSEAICEADMVEKYGDFTPTREMHLELFPSIDYNTTPIEMLPLFLVQLTKFRCGGLCVGTLTNHTLFDGWGAINFINSWASFARGEEKLNVKPCYDRRFLQGNGSAPKFRPIECDPLPLMNGCSDVKAEARMETKVAMLKLPRNLVEAIKKKSNHQGQNGGRRPYSTFEAITAHVWRCACKARAHDSDQPTMIRFMIDIRNKLQPPLPPGYFGCSALPTVTPTCFSGDIVSRPLSYAASKIREGIERMTNEYIRSTLDFLKSQGDMSELRTSFHTAGNNRGFFLGNPNLSCTSLTQFPVYDADFGWGKPIHMGPGLVTSDGKVSILPAGPNGDGSLKVIVGLQSRHAHSFKIFFYRDLIQEDAKM